MTDLSQETPNIINNEPPKIDKRKGIRNPLRYLDNGTYSHHPNDPEYYKKYYHLKIACPIECFLCGSIVGQQKINRHQKSKMCQKRAMIKIGEYEKPTKKVKDLN